MELPTSLLIEQHTLRLRVARRLIASKNADRVKRSHLLIHLTQVFDRVGKFHGNVAQDRFMCHQGPGWKSRQ